MRLDRSSRRAFTAALALLLAAAGGTLVALPAAAATPGAHASAVLAASPSYDGIRAAWPGDRDKDPAHAATTVDGTECWTMSQDPLNKYLYVDVDTAAKPSGSRYANVAVTYFDAAATSMRIEYDGSASRFQASPSATLEGTGTWRTHTFQLDAIRFLDGANGADFRIGVNAAGGVIPPVCFSELSVTFSDVPRLSLVDPSLLLTTDDATLDIATMADSVDFTLSAEDGTSLRTGVLVPDADGSAALDVSDLGPGYYGIAFGGDVQGERLERQASFGIITPTPEGALDPSAFFGISSHFGHYGAAEDALMESLADIGYGHIRGDVNWELIEKSQGVYSFDRYAFHAKSAKALELGMQPMGVVAYRNPFYDGGVTPSTPEGLAGYGAFAAATAAEYAPEIRDFNIYNEFNGRGFNNGACGITAACYVDLLKAAYGPMHAANPDVNVMGPITSGIDAAWFDEFFANGGIDAIDTFAFNVYGYALHGQNTPPEDTLLVSALPDVVDRVAAEAGDRDVPVWITENGWPTHAIGSTPAQQAEDLVRASVLVMAAGVDVYTWYSALDDGTDPNEREHNFGIFTRPDEAALGVSPKPAAVAAAVLIRQVTGKQLQPREDLGDAGAYSYPYTDADGAIRVLWAPDGAAVRVTGTGPLTLTDSRGAVTTFTPGADGTVLDLDADPVYLSGAVDAVIASEDAPELALPSTSIAGDPVTAVVTMDRSALHGPHRGLTASAPGTESAGFSVDAGVLTSTLTLPATRERGVRGVRVAVSDSRGGGEPTTLALLSARTDTVDQFSVAAQPRILPGDGRREHVVDVAVTNNGPAPAAPGAIRFAIASAQGERPADEPIGAGETVTYRVDAGDPVGYVPQRFRIEAGEGARGASVSGELTFSAIEREGSSAATSIDLSALGSWVSTTGPLSGPADLGGTLAVAYDDGGLVLDATVVDESHHGAREPADLWQTDSIQFAVSDRSPRADGAQSVEIGAALLDGGVAVQTFIAPVGQEKGPTPEAAADIVRDEAAGTTHYIVRLPWAALGFDGAPSEPFAMSFLVNDDDTGAAAGDSRAGFLQWGSGIGTTPKNPHLFRDAQLVG
ncbi:MULTISPECIES: hypothetical protein [unclassified Microbacterium]|uniref:hypothetical protein n=1 Tax=unclassified Microbacterium TaxID=2609290 RepID=UPI0030106036